jgi:hypothetical protein
MATAAYDTAAAVAEPEADAVMVIASPSSTTRQDNNYQQQQWQQQQQETIVTIASPPFPAAAAAGASASIELASIKTSNIAAAAAHGDDDSSSSSAGRIHACIVLDPIYKDGRVVGYVAERLFLAPGGVKGAIKLALREVLGLIKAEGRACLSLGLAVAHHIQPGGR